MLMLLATVALSCGLMAGSAWADEPTAKMSVGNVNAQPGQEVTLPITISGNPGFAGAALEISVPSGVTLKSIAAGDLLSTGSFSANGSRATWYADNNVTADGIVANVTVVAPKAVGVYKVSASLVDGIEANFSNQDFQPVPVEFEVGAVTVPGNLAEAIVTVSPNRYTYNGKAKAPSVTVKFDGSTLKKGADYKVSYKNNTNAGTATATVSGLGAYQGSKTAKFAIAKAANPFKIAKATRNVKLKNVKKKNQVVAGPIVKKKAQGTTKYTIYKVSKAKYKKKFTINKKTGKITVKKGTPKGTYKVTVKANAAGNKNYKKSSTKTVVVTIKVK